MKQIILAQGVIKSFFDYQQPEGQVQITFAAIEPKIMHSSTIPFFFLTPWLNENQYSNIL